MNDLIRKLYSQVADEQCDGKEWAIGGLDNANRFAELLFDEFCDVVIDCDENPKLILHEPYRTIIAKLCDHFNGVE